VISGSRYLDRADAKAAIAKHFPSRKEIQDALRLLVDAELVTVVEERRAFADDGPIEDVAGRALRPDGPNPRYCTRAVLTTPYYEPDGSQWKAAA
jgi:hypothetical protein